MLSRASITLFRKVFFVVTGISILASCVNRTFNTPSQARPKIQLQTREPLRVLSVQEFEDALYTGAREALKFFSQAEMNAFFDDNAIRELNFARKRSFLQEMQYQFPLQWALSRINTSPVWISRTGPGSIPDGGLVLAGRDLFPEGFYRTFGSVIPLRELMTQMPWFEWDDVQKVFVPRRGGAGERILRELFYLRSAGESFALYRGGDLSPFRGGGATRDPYVSGRAEGSELLFFSSPSINTALSWARPGVWKMELSKLDMLADVVSPQPSVYVGFEYHYPEFAFLRTNSRSGSLLEKLRPNVLCVKPEGADATSMNGPGGMPTPATGDFKKCDDKWISAHLSGFPEDVVELKKAVVQANAKIKMQPVQDSALQEGQITCELTRGTEIEYTQAYAVSNQQVWIHSSGIDMDWNCPRSFSSRHFYMDADKVNLSLTP